LNSPLEINSEIPPQLGEVILKAIAPLSEDRFSSAEEMADALRGVDYSVTSLPAAEKGWSRYLIAAAAVLLIVLLAAWALRSDKDTTTEEAPSQPAMQTPVSGEPDQLEASDMPLKKAAPAPEGKNSTYKGFTFTVEPSDITDEKVESTSQPSVEEKTVTKELKDEKLKREEDIKEEETRPPAGRPGDFRHPPPHEELPSQRGEHPLPPPGRGHPPPRDGHPPPPGRR